MDDARARAEACLAAIARLDGKLRAFITPMPDAARVQASLADAAAREGRSLGPLHGMVVALKDCIDVAGVRGTAGSRFFAGRVSPADATVVARLRAAGATIVGTANLHEFCFGGTTQNAHWGACRNPWDTTRIPGGSSGGSAVAVAAGMAEAALGTDTGGSIRGPCSITGVTGLRPSVGAVPCTGIFPVSPPLDTCGPMARSAADVALVFAAIAGHDPADPFSEAREPPEAMRRLSAGVAGLRVGIPRNHYFDGAPAAIAQAALDAARVLERLGARLEDIVVQGAEDAPANVQRIIFADASALHRGRLASDPGLFDPLVRERLRPGLALPATELADALRWRERFIHSTRRMLATDVDLVLSPMVATEVPRADDARGIVAVSAAIMRNAWGWAAAGVPALALPCGFSPDGMPIGLQLAAGHWRDDVVLRAGHAYQRCTDWHMRLPPLHARRGAATEGTR
jgi:aspartyl-tRNA(Asn)/glutamyl-tRNA(Gln) amidotransferase subunit A